MVLLVMMLALIAAFLALALAHPGDDRHLANTFAAFARHGHWHRNQLRRTGATALNVAAAAAIATIVAAAIATAAALTLGAGAGRGEHVFANRRVVPALERAFLKGHDRAVDLLQLIRAAALAALFGCHTGCISRRKTSRDKANSKRFEQRGRHGLFSH